MGSLSLIFGNAWYLFVAILCLGLIIMVHEVGHFVASRLLKIPVAEFALGFGPRIFGFTRGDTKYSLRLLPFGGYCLYFGEDWQKDKDDPRAYFNMPAWRRLIAILAGPAMNFVLAFVVMYVLLVFVGTAFSVNAIGAVVPDSPAANAGLIAGDVIVSVDGTEVKREEVSITQKLVSSHTDTPAQLVVQRGGQTIDVSITPMYNDTEKRYMIGIQFGSDLYRMGALRGFPAAGRALWDTTTQMVAGLRDLVFKQQGAGDVMGVVGTVSLISKQVQSGLQDMLWIVVLITLNVGILNLLPLPALDGSRALFLIAEMVRGKPVDRNKEALIHMIGLGAFALLFLVITYKDIVRLVTGG